ncbi:MAG: hypothetical protein M0Z91_01115 [Actinomycetota bacterium]|nr:hypothetical protein [Actinomycetota bacterium]
MSAPIFPSILATNANLPKITPDISAVPGANLITQVFGWADGIALAMCVLAVLIGAGLWAFGPMMDNPRSASMGKKMLIAAAVGTIVLGAGPHLISALFSIGTSAH